MGVDTGCIQYGGRESVYRVYTGVTGWCAYLVRIVELVHGTHRRGVEHAMVDRAHGGVAVPSLLHSTDL